MRRGQGGQGSLEDASVEHAAIPVEEVFGPNAPFGLVRRLQQELEGARGLVSSASEPGCPGCVKLGSLYRKLVAYLVSLSAASVDQRDKLGRLQGLFAGTLRRCFPEQARRLDEREGKPGAIEEMPPEVLARLALSWANSQREEALEAGRRMADSDARRLEERVAELSGQLREAQVARQRLDTLRHSAGARLVGVRAEALEAFLEARSSLFDLVLGAAREAGGTAVWELDGQTVTISLQGRGGHRQDQPPVRSYQPAPSAAPRADRQAKDGRGGGESATSQRPRTPEAAAPRAQQQAAAAAGQEGRPSEGARGPRARPAPSAAPRADRQAKDSRGGGESAASQRPRTPEAAAPRAQQQAAAAAGQEGRPSEGARGPKGAEGADAVSDEGSREAQDGGEAASGKRSLPSGEASGPGSQGGADAGADEPDRQAAQGGAGGEGPGEPQPPARPVDPEEAVAGGGPGPGGEAGQGGPPPTWRGPKEMGVTALGEASAWVRSRLQAALPPGCDIDAVEEALVRGRIVDAVPCGDGEVLYFPLAGLEDSWLRLRGDRVARSEQALWTAIAVQLRGRQRRQAVAEALGPFLAAGWDLTALGAVESAGAWLCLERPGQGDDGRYRRGVLGAFWEAASPRVPEIMMRPDAEVVWVAGPEGMGEPQGLAAGADLWMAPSGALASEAAWTPLRRKAPRPVR